MRAAQRRRLYVLERMDVDDCIAATVDLAADERHDAAGGADVEGRGARAEAVAGHERRIADHNAQRRPRMRSPDAGVLDAERAAACARRYRLRIAGPVEF